MGMAAPPTRLSRFPARRATGVLLVLLSGVACGSHRVQVPPQLDLVPYGRVGLATFTVERARGSLHELATRRFEEEILSAQRGIEVQELGPADSPAAAQARAAERDVPVVFFGQLKVSAVQPRGGLLGLTLPHVEATVSAELTVQLVSTKSGGTLWRASATASEKVGEVALIGGEPYFSAKDPKDAYGHLVNRLVAAVTRDFWPTWRKR